METRLTRGEYWLLETAVNTYYPMSYLCSDRYSKPNGLEQVFNKPGHGLDRNRLIATLGSLFRDGLVEALRDDEACFLNESQISGALDEKRPLENLENSATWTRYRMTPHGAAAWEAFAAPEWDRYILDDHDVDLEARSGTGTAICMTLPRLHRYLHNLHLAGYEVATESVAIKACGAWSPTYWKELPSGHRAHYEWHGDPFAPRKDDLRQFAFEGFCDFRDSWYRWR